MDSTDGGPVRLSRATPTWPTPAPYPRYAAAPSPGAWKAWGRHVVLLALTATTVFLAGSRNFLVYDFTGGAALAVGLLGILLAHEMGHYLACRYYGVDATLPFFIPAPPVLVGTFGALIRIRAPIPHRKALFDIGIAGPLAGFVVCMPVLALGVLEGQVLPTPVDDRFTLSFGEPLLFQWATLWLKGPLPEGSTLFIGSWGLAAWFGLFVTALNLIPVGQLDGGHVTYALFRRHAHVVSRIGFVACLALIWYGPNWAIWSVLLLLVGRRPHPPTLNDHAPLGRGRQLLALVGLVVFVVCFVPDPIVGSWEMLAQDF